MENPVSDQVGYFLAAPIQSHSRSPAAKIRSLRLLDALDVLDAWTQIIKLPCHSRPLQKLGCRASHNGFGFQEFVDTGGAPFAPDSRLFVAAEWRARINARAIQMNHSRTQTGCDLARAFHRTAIHKTGKSIGSVVSDGDRLFLGVVRNHGQYRAEDLFLGDGHRVVHAAEDGGLSEIASLESVGSAETSHNHPRPFFDSFRDQFLDSLVLPCV